MCGGENQEPRTQLAMEASEEAGEPFHCLICLELVHKPIVQSCGHVFCFWCVRRSMNAKRQSQCPVCRRPYTHFPRVCEMLHFFLMKVAPEEYGRRAQEMQVMEETKQIFSPRIPESPMSLIRSPRKGDDPSRTKVRQLGRSPVASPGEATGAKDLRGTHECFVKSAMVDDSRCLSPSGESALAGSEEREIDAQQGSGTQQSETCNGLSVEDFSCASCKKFLYRPVVLNCGQVFCESCVGKSQTSLMCPSCRSFHSGGSVHVCLELHHYFERAFPTYYEERKEQIRGQEMGNESIDTDISEAEEDMECDGTGRQFVHIGAGCDGCGMFPIVGDRYRCKDCAEKTGYDLCGMCYKKGGSVVCGRFNQQHTPDHRMEEIPGEFRALPGPLRLNLGNGIIQRRRQQQLLDDLDDYIDSFV